jgi:serine protease inhibitor
MEHTDKTANLVISPLSLFAALSLTSIGAKGSTLSQLQQALRLSQNSLMRKGGMAHIIASMVVLNLK